MSRIYPDSGSPLILGRGFNSVAQTAASTAILPSSIVTQAGSPSTGQDVTYIQKSVETFTQLRSELDISS